MAFSLLSPGVAIRKPWSWFLPLNEGSCDSCDGVTVPADSCESDMSLYHSLNTDAQTCQDVITELGKHYKLMKQSSINVSYNEFEYAQLDFTFSHHEKLLDYVMSRVKMVDPATTRWFGRKAIGLRVNSSSSLLRITRVQKQRQLGTFDRRRDLIMIGATPYSQRWGYVRIITGTILGGILGFYVMHRLEVSYKEKLKERLRIYEMEMMREKEQQNRQGGFDEFEESVS